MYLVKDLYQQHGNVLGLELMAGSAGMDRKIYTSEIHIPGLALAGYSKNYPHKNIVVFDKTSSEYLKELTANERTDRLGNITHGVVPAIIFTHRQRPVKELIDLCESNEIPLFRSNMTANQLLNRLFVLLTEEFSPETNCHGTLMEVFGVGVMITGDSSIGKSEAALGLVERGHRLVTDDIIHVKLREGSSLEGYGDEVTRHHMEIRGVGIINVAHLYGAVCVRDSKMIDIVVKLENWDEEKYYDRVGLEENFCTILGVQLPYHILPVKPGRDVVLLLETIVLNHRLKAMGYNSAKEFRAKLLAIIDQKTSKKRCFIGEDSPQVESKQ